MEYSPRAFTRMLPQRRQRLVLEVVRAAAAASTPSERLRLYRVLAADAVTWPSNAREVDLHTAGLVHAVRTVADVPGEVVECGVGHGASLVTLARAVHVLAPSKRVLGFDSFGGFPPATAEDLGRRVPTVGEAPSGWTDTSPSMVVEALDAPAELIPGFFDQTIPDRLPDAIAMLHVDCDLYSSTIRVLEHGLPRVSPGGLVILDEYREQSRFPGAIAAIDEALSVRSLKPVWDGVLHRHVVWV